MKIVLTCHTWHFRNVWWYQSNFRLGILNNPRFRKFYVTCLCDWSGKLERSLPRSPLPRPRAKTWQEKAPADWALFSPHRASHTKLFLSSKQHLRRFYLANTFLPAAVLLRSKVFHDSRRMILFSSETEIETLLFTKLETKGWTAWFLDCTELVQPIINSARKGYRERHPWKRS